MAKIKDIMRTFKGIDCVDIYEFGYNNNFSRYKCGDPYDYSQIIKEYGNREVGEINISKDEKTNATIRLLPVGKQFDIKISDSCVEEYCMKRISNCRKAITTIKGMDQRLSRGFDIWDLEYEIAILEDISSTYLKKTNIAKANKSE